MGPREFTKFHGKKVCYLQGVQDPPALLLVPVNLAGPNICMNKHVNDKKYAECTS